MFTCQSHGGIKANDREFTGNIQNGLNYGFPDFWIQVIQLGSIIPGHAGAVIAMINEAGIPITSIHTTENYSRISAVVVMVVNFDLHPRISRQIRSIERIAGKGTIG